jgi:hypothetical protein
MVYIYQGIGIGGNPIPAGPISVTGLIYQSLFGFYQLNPRFYQDILVPAPQAPSLLSPPNGYVTQDTLPLFDWTDVQNATQYRIQVDDDSMFTSPAIDTIINASLFQTVVPLPADFTYYWRVAAGDIYNRWSVWSAVWNFTITSVGIEENLTIGEFNLTITPNPAKDKVYVRYTYPLKVKASLTLYNVLGEICLRHTSELPPGSNLSNPPKADGHTHRVADKGSIRQGVFVIDGKRLGTGIYILRFKANEYEVRQKLILTR